MSGQTRGCLLTLVRTNSVFAVVLRVHDDAMLGDGGVVRASNNSKPNIGVSAENEGVEAADAGTLVSCCPFSGGKALHSRSQAVYQNIQLRRHCVGN